MSLNELLPDSEGSATFPSGKPNQQQLGISGRARVAMSDGSGNNLTSTGGALDVNTSGGAITDTPEFFEDTDFTAGDSPATLDINAALGRNATKGSILNDGSAAGEDFTLAFSTDGAVFGDEITLKRGEILEFNNQSTDTIRITHSGTDSAYRVLAI